MKTHEHLPDDLGMVCKNKLIAAPSKLVVNQRKEKVLSKTIQKYSAILSWCEGYVKFSIHNIKEGSYLFFINLFRKSRESLDLGS